MDSNRDAIDPVYRFEIKKREGTRHEETVLRSVGKALSTTVQHFSYNESPSVQLAGVDGITETGTKIDVKVQRREHIETGNIPIELWSDIVGQNPGWFYAGDASLIAWAYNDRVSDSLLSTAFILHKTEGFVDWFHKHKDRFRRVDIENKGYTAVVSLVPLITIPGNFLQPFDIIDETGNG
jgi:hypothetical protein